MCKKGNNTYPCLLNVLIPQKVPLISKTSLESNAHDGYGLCTTNMYLLILHIGL